MDVHEKVVGFMSNPAQALGSNCGILKEILECHICNSLMLDPYTLHCGHTFCGNCLKLWIQERQDRSTCPQCRRDIDSEPAASIALRELALAVAHSWNQSPNLPKLSADELANKESPVFFPNGPTLHATYDADDDVYRCPYCSHEVEDDECTNCGHRFRPTGYEPSPPPSSDNEIEGDNDSFDDDNDYDDDDDDDDLQPQYEEFRRRLEENDRRVEGYESVPECGDNPMEACYRYIWIRLNSLDMPPDMDDRHQELEERIGPNFPRLYQKLTDYWAQRRHRQVFGHSSDNDSLDGFVQADEEEEEEEDTSSTGSEAESDASVESQDSLLAEAREKNSRKRKTMMEDSEGSDIEVVEVRSSRPVVIDDDDDDE